jgi:hypothetical protein
MRDRVTEFRTAAGECLALAQTTTTDANTRAALLLMAQKWLERANEASNGTMTSRGEGEQMRR